MTAVVPHPRICKFCELTGWTEKAVRRKIELGVWLEGREYHRAAQMGEITIDIEAYNKWAEGQPQGVSK